VNRAQAKTPAAIKRQAFAEFSFKEEEAVVRL
jgi:hypothetical protein